MSKRKLGDRWDARRIRDLHGLAQLSIDLKPNRSVSDVYINRKIDVTELVKYIESRKEKGDKITYFHAFLAATGRLLYNRPIMNRFVANRHLYEHNDVKISFIAKVAFNDKSREVMVITPVAPDDNINTLSEKVGKEIEKIRSKEGRKDKGANNATEILGGLPNILRVPIMAVMKFMDKKGILPKSLADDNLYYSSIIVSNLGSIKCGAIYHNINDFGTCSSLATFGEIHDEEVIIDGKRQIRKLCEFGINIDERIGDGYYFAKSLKLLENLLAHPEMLEQGAAEQIPDEELR